jgi:DNA-binding MarR family transcriptional regulator
MTQLVNGRARPKPLTAGPGYLVRNAHKALSRRLALELARHGIAFKHYYYLRTLFEEDGIMQAELSERTGMERATVTVVLDTMERQGLVKRIRSPEDRRKIHVYLTPKGRRLRQPLLDAVGNVTRAALAGISPLEFERLRKTLGKIVANLEGDLAQRPAPERPAKRKAGSAA